MKDKPLLLGAMVASIAASMCCILPLAVALLGVGSVAAAATFERLRVPLSLLTFGFLGLAFYFNYRPAKEHCEPGSTCSVPENRKRTRVFLWIVTIIVLAFWGFPYYSRFLL